MTKYIIHINYNLLFETESKQEAENTFNELSKIETFKNEIALAEYDRSKVPTKFEDFPEDIQKDIISTLGAFKEVHVITEYGETKVTTGLTMKSDYGFDHHIVSFDQSILSEDQKILGYVNNFYSFPIFYKGERDYKKMQLAKDKKQVISLDQNGNLVYN